MLKKYHVSKNLANLYNVDKTSLDLRFTTDNNMTIKINGVKASGKNVISLVYPGITLPAGTYTVMIKMISGTISGLTDGVFFGINENTYSQRTTPGILQIGDVGVRVFTLSNDTVLSSIDIAPGYGSFGSVFTDAVFECMLVSGSYTAKTMPAYEPYSSEVWHEIPYYLHNTSTDTITTLPADIYANAATATVGLKGQTAQSGTPTPQNPIMPQGTGERTGNLFNDFDIVGQVPSVTNGNLVNYNNGACTDLIKLSSGLLTLSIYEAMVVYVFLYDANESFLGWVNLSSTGTRTTQQITNYENAKYARVRTDNYSTYLNEKKIMLNTGSTALPYESYGVKIPISSANTTTPVYLGEVQTTRRVKKYEFTGQENLAFYSGSPSGIGAYYRISDMLSNARDIGVCSHFFPIYAPSQSYSDNITFGVSNNVVYFMFSTATVSSLNLSDLPSIKTWLQQQYAAGTPVTVWYVLATPTTGIVNEPLRKIGDYADEVANISIPVTAGGDTISVDTTVQPSEVTVNYKGWHPKTPKESNNGQWS